MLYTLSLHLTRYEDLMRILEKNYLPGRGAHLNILIEFALASCLSFAKSVVAFGPNIHIMACLTSLEMSHGSFLPCRTPHASSKQFFVCSSPFMSQNASDYFVVRTSIYTQFFSSYTSVTCILSNLLSHPKAILQRSFRHLYTLQRSDLSTQWHTAAGMTSSKTGLTPFM